MAKKDSKIAAIVLAAGLSQRMGSRNKLHLPVAGVSLLRHGVEVLLAADLAEVIVVLGHERESTEALLDGLPIHTIYNVDHRKGQMSSVHCGLSAISPSYDGVMVALGDQPALEVEDINYLIQAFARRGSAQVLVPAFAGERGNPITLSREARRDIMAGRRKLGWRRFIENNSELVMTVEMENAAVVLELDTPEEYSKYLSDQESVADDDGERKGH